MMNGAPNASDWSRTPARAGEAACATVRVAFVTLAAAVRSSGYTTATTYDCRAGTSIWESAKRARSKASARPRLGEKGMAASKTLEGRWVKTIVFTSPMRFASRAATRNTERRVEQEPPLGGRQGREEAAEKRRSPGGQGPKRAANRRDGVVDTKDTVSTLRRSGLR